MTPAEKIAELRSRTRYDPDGRDWVGVLLDIAEAAVARVAQGHSGSCPRAFYHGVRPIACTCGHDNLAAKLAAMGGG